MEKLLLNEIITKYSIDCNASSLIIKVMEDYPHMFVLNSLKEDFIVKKVTKMYCKNLDKLYDYLKDIEYIALPSKTIDGNYSIVSNNETYLVYKKNSEIEKTPGPIWWAECLNCIHNIKINSNDFNYLDFNLYKETLNILKSAIKYLDDKTKSKINMLLNIVDDKPCQVDSQLVLSHSDPCDVNVMLDDNEYKLIDTDGMRLLPKEFDIQRLLHNIVINSNSLDYSLDYWNDFLNNYEKNTHDIININSLKMLYIYDLIRTFSWLTIVSRDLSRFDCERQSKELKSYQNSIINDSHIKFLQKI